ncbi:MAG: T9SS type A sorting domain-containing protein [Bacteroidota bacterium]
MKTPRPLLLLQLLLLQFTLTAQVQWYQNQDGSNPPPYGTYASSVQSFNSHSFIACYQWQVNNDEYTWKISKTQTNGAELRTFFVSGIMASAEVRIRKNNSVYVLKRSYPYGQNPEYTVYRLNSNFDILAQRTITFPGEYAIINLNAFEIDDDGNVYFAGDGQYPDGPGFGFSSFVLKTNKNLVNRWSRMDSVQTSYTRLHVDDHQWVTVVEDFYTSYPAVKIIRINASGTAAVTTTIVPDTGRFSLFSMLDNNNHLLLYGGKMVNDTVQAIYLCRVSRFTGNVLLRKTLFAAPGTQLCDMKMDNQGRLFSLVIQYYPGQQLTKISRINPGNGQLLWNRSLRFDVDSCQLGRLVVTDPNRFYAVGEKRSGSYFARGYALRLKKNGQLNGHLTAPDSVAWQRYHTLSDGIMDNNGQLIAVGNTNDFDTITYSSSYYRAFAVRYDENCNNNRTAREETSAETNAQTGEKEILTEKLHLYPNPVQNQLLISNMNPEEYDRIAVYNMQGALVLQQKVTTTTARLDMSSFAEGVYVLLFRSSASLKEKTIKFVVSR